ncbi:MAG TPA: HupE/UreJ family protein, partial [Haliscomenobacter sp.]|nr:HupE/UreJ family protein [Haliscomenobacter sp.]
MQSIFQTYLELGFAHIADLAGYDHILFIVVLCAIYRLQEWRKVAIL